MRHRNTDVLSSGGPAGLLHTFGLEISVLYVWNSNDSQKYVAIDKFVVKIKMNQFCTLYLVVLFHILTVLVHSQSSSGPPWSSAAQRFAMQLKSLYISNAPVSNEHCWENKIREMGEKVRSKVERIYFFVTSEEDIGEGFGRQGDVRYFLKRWVCVILPSRLEREGHSGIKISSSS